MPIRAPLLLILILAVPLFLKSQDPGENFRYPTEGEYIEFLKGELPLIISVPHGGYMKPGNIPERTGRVAKNQDIYTIEIAYEIIREIHELTGKYPHVT